MYRLGGCRLVSVKAAYTLCGISGDEVPVNPLRKAGPLRFSRGELTNGGQNLAVVIAPRKGVEHFVDARDGRRFSGSANRQPLRHERPSNTPLRAIDSQWLAVRRTGE